jgi:8-oxo-dGTP diphosphatase
MGMPWSAQRRDPGREGRRSRKRDTVAIAAGIIVDGRGRILVARRLPGSHLEGLWEFPGGKVRPGESAEAAVRREVEEEVGLAVEETVFLHRQQFRYPDRAVEIDFFLARRFSGEPTPRQGQELAWVAPAELDCYPMPPANAAVIAMLRAQGE